MADPVSACELCGELLGPADDVRPVGGGGAHRECLLRAVAGGIGHHEDHSYWCLRQHDPDGGRTYRRSAIEVDELLARQAPPPAWLHEEVDGFRIVDRD